MAPRLHGQVSRPGRAAGAIINRTATTARPEMWRERVGLLAGLPPLLAGASSLYLKIRSASTMARQTKAGGTFQSQQRFPPRDDHALLDVADGVEIGGIGKNFGEGVQGRRKLINRGTDHLVHGHVRQA